MMTMLLGGLWHGASWNFVIWGALHGAVLVVERMLGVTGEGHGRRWVPALAVVARHVPLRSASPGCFSAAPTLEGAHDLFHHAVLRRGGVHHDRRRWYWRCW